MAGRQGVGQQYEDASSDVSDDVCNTQDGSSTDESPWTEIQRTKFRGWKSDESWTKVCGRKFNGRKFVDVRPTKVGLKFGGRPMKVQLTLNV
jgi:hypothetical protein